MRVNDEELDDRGCVILLRRAALEAEQTILVRRAAVLSEEEAEVLRLFREAPAGERRSLL